MDTGLVDIIKNRHLSDFNNPFIKNGHLAEFNKPRCKTDICRICNNLSSHTNVSEIMQNGHLADLHKLLYPDRIGKNGHLAEISVQLSIPAHLFAPQGAHKALRAKEMDKKV